MYFASNIKFLRTRRKRTQEDAAAALDMVRSTYSGYENGVGQPGLEMLLSIAKYYKMSVDTLLKVDLTTFSESKLSELERGFDVYITGSKLRVLASTVDSRNRENIELVPLKAKAGYTQGYHDPEFIRSLPAFQLPFLSPERKYRTFQISGDSMFPIPDKSYVTCEYLQDWGDVKDGNAYIILTQDEGIVFKVVYNHIRGKKKLLLKSLNPLYEAYEISVTEIKEIWKFINYISAELPEPELPRDELVSEVMKLKKDVEKLKTVKK